MSADEPVTLGQAATRRAVFLNDLERAAGFPAFAGTVVALTSLSGDTDAPVDELTAVLRRDVTLTARTVQIANTLPMKTTTEPVLDIRHAVLLIGFDRVKSIALAASIFGGAGRRPGPLRELTVLSLVTANLAVRFAEALGLEELEQAYLCGMLRHFGEFVVAGFRPIAYRAVLRENRGEALPEATAEREVLGFTFEELGIDLAERLHMPRTVVATMRRRRALAGVRELSAQGKLHAIADLATELASALYRRSPWRVGAAIEALARAYGPVLALDADRVPRAVIAALGDTEASLGALGLPLDEVLLARQLDEARRQLAAALARAGGASPAADEPAEDADRLEAALAAVASAPDAGAAIALALDALLAAGFERAILLRTAPDGKTMKAATGAGATLGDAVTWMALQLHELGGPLARAAMDGLDLYAVTTADPFLLRDRTVQRLRPRLLALLPLRAPGGALLGALYFDHRSEGAEPPPFRRRQLAEVRDHLAALLTRPTEPSA